MEGVSGGKANTTGHWSSPPRKLVGVVASVALALAGAVLIAPMARAADSPFDVTGAVVPDAGVGAPLTDDFGNVKELGPKNANTTKIGVIHSAAVPMLDKTNPNANVDLRQAWLKTERDLVTDDVWLYFAWERDSNSGSGFIAYEFMHAAKPVACAYGTATEAQLIASCTPGPTVRPATS